MMKKLVAFALVLMMALSLCACGGDGGGAKTVTETEHVTINGLCVDDSYTEDDSPLRMVYLFYTLTPGDVNLEIDSNYTDMTIGENTYTSENHANAAKACKYMENYYYSSYIEDVYMGESINVVATFKVPEGALTAGQPITFADDQIPGIEGIRMSTDMLQRISSPEQIAELIDPEGYATVMEAREPADPELAAMVSNAINGYYWWFYVNGTYYEVEFSAPNNFEVRSVLDNSGTYTVQKGYIFCTYPSNGYTIEIPYEIVDGTVDMDFVEAFDVH